MNIGRPEPPASLNVVITGQICCGDRYLAAVLSDHPHITCHSVLLDADDSVRRYYHELYFGASVNTPDWLVEGHISGEQYLTNKIFDNTLKDEEVIGVSVLYPHLYARDMWEYFSAWCRAGDFCLINMKRNPVSCFASLKLWERDGNTLHSPAVTKFNRGYADVLGHPSTFPMGFPADPVVPVWVELPELCAFVRMQIAAEMKVADMCDDRLEISYEELLLNFRELSSHLFSFLGSSPVSRSLVNKWARRFRACKGRPLSSVIANWSSLCAEAPLDIRPFLDPRAI
jgi:hypothetical protein